MTLPEVTVRDSRNHNLGKFSAVQFSKAINIDCFLMYDPIDSNLFDLVLEHQPFWTSQLEFSKLHELKLTFLHRKDDVLLFFICEFLSTEDIQKFFRSVDSMKEKVILFSWYRIALRDAIENCIF